MRTSPLTRGLFSGFVLFSASSGASETGPSELPAQVALGPCAQAISEGRLGRCVPALTPVVLATTSPLSSRTSKTGDRFEVVLAKAVELDGAVLLPEGVRGEGEVVHAKGSGSGVGGELILAARYLLLQNTRLKLRSMKALAHGKDQIDGALAVSIAVPVAGFLVRGKQVDVPAGTIAEAKTAEEVWISGNPTNPVVNNKSYEGTPIDE